MKQSKPIRTMSLALHQMNIFLCLTFCFCSQCLCLLHLHWIRMIARCQFAMKHRFDHFVSLVPKSNRLLLYRLSTICNFYSFYFNHRLEIGISLMLLQMYLSSSSVQLSRRADVDCFCLPPNFINCRTVFNLILLSDEGPAVAACLLPLDLFYRTQFPSERQKNKQEKNHTM